MNYTTQNLIDSYRLTGRGWPKPLADAVSVSAAAQLVTAPLIAGISGRFSLVAMAANLAAALSGGMPVAASFLAMSAKASSGAARSVSPRCS